MWSFIKQNPELVVAVLLYIAINVAPRPHPDDHRGWRRMLWLILDRLSVLSAATMPGRLKWLLLPTAPREEPDQLPKPAEAEAKDEGKDKDQP